MNTKQDVATPTGKTATKADQYQADLATIAKAIAKEGWVEIFGEQTNFMPVIRDHVFASLVKFYMDADGLETSGNFYIDPGSHTVEYVSEAANNNATGVRVVVSAGAGAELLRRDRLAGVTPNGQWHTHPYSGAYWSLTDVHDQIKDINMVRAFHRSGERYFMCVGEYHFLVRRIRWGDDGVTYEDKDAFLTNGRMLSGVKRIYHHSTEGAGIVSNAVLRSARSIMDLAGAMAEDIEFHKKLSPAERVGVYDMIEARYGQDIYEILDTMNATTATEAVNKVFAILGVELGDELMMDRSLRPIIGVVANEHERV